MFDRKKVTRYIRDFQEWPHPPLSGKHGRIEHDPISVRAHLGPLVSLSSNEMPSSIGVLDRLRIDYGCKKPYQAGYNL